MRLWPDTKRPSVVVRLSGGVGDAKKGSKSGRKKKAQNNLFDLAQGGMM
jgi:hypothetical protein